MPVTIQDICALPDLGLTVVAGQSGTGRDVRWVHVSEVTDPTPWLQGDELLLTTGLKIGPDEDFREYVHRLADAGLAGIGFGVGLEHGDVPPAMIAAADERGIPVLRIPVDTPYMAISEAVSNMLAADRYDAIGRAFEAQQQLTKAALGSEKTLVREIARQLQGWAIQTDAAGEVLQAWPPESLERMPGLLPDLVRARESGGKGSASIISPGASTVIQPMSVDGLPRGFLLVGVDRPLGPYERLVLTAAVALLTLEAERSRSISARLHQLRSSVLAEALRDLQPSREAVRQIASWGVDSSAIRICVLLTTGGQAARLLLDRVIRLLSDADMPGAATLYQNGSDVLVAVLLPDASESTESLAAMVRQAEDVYLGIGDQYPVTELHRSFGGALQAASIGRSEHQSVTGFSDLAAMQLLLKSNNLDSLYTFLDRVLGPLRADQATGKNATLRQTLEVFLSCNGHWNEAASQLQVHRHTLRSRMEKIAVLTGRDPDSAYARMELWLALLIEGSFGQRSSLG